MLVYIFLDENLKFIRIKSLTNQMGRVGLKHVVGTWDVVFLRTFQSINQTILNQSQRPHLTD